MKNGRRYVTASAQFNFACSLLLLLSPWAFATPAILRQVELRDLFKNQDATEFCIVTIPTQLAIAESKRLLEALNTQGVAVRNIVVNQVRG